MAHILVIDDDSVARLAIGKMLEGANHDVAYAVNGEQGLDVYGKGQFDVVLVDLAMPVMNGLRTIQEMREIDVNARIIAITGVSPEQLDLAREYGAMRTMVKPVKPDELIEAVDGVVEKRLGWDDVK